MQNPTDSVVAQLAADWPRWQIWTVPRLYQCTVWCARRWDWEPGDTVLNAASAAELTEVLEAEADR
jgi:hypothetical protein